MNILKYDLHLHSLDHKYFRRERYPELDSEDKKNIERLIYQSIDRGLDIISITDHDTVIPSLYGRNFVDKKNLPIKIVTGAEIEIYDQVFGEYIHICALGIEKIPDYLHWTLLDEIIDKLKEDNATIIFNHPKYSPISFVNKIERFDGYEYRNGKAGIFTIDSINFINQEHYYKLEETLKSIEKLENSDYHLSYNELLRTPYPNYIGTKDKKWFTDNNLI